MGEFIAISGFWLLMLVVISISAYRIGWENAQHMVLDEPYQSCVNRAARNADLDMLERCQSFKVETEE